jgi:hypothetical protein
MNNSEIPVGVLIITKIVKKGARIYQTGSKRPIAIAEENFLVGDMGILDYSTSYPIDVRNKLLILPGLKKNANLEKYIKNLVEKKCPNKKK